MTTSALPGKFSEPLNRPRGLGSPCRATRTPDGYSPSSLPPSPSGGRVLELGAGTGVGTAWIVHGLAERCERKTAEVCRRLLDHPDLISLEIASSTGLILSTRRRPD